MVGGLRPPPRTQRAQDMTGPQARRVLLDAAERLSFQWSLCSPCWPLWLFSCSRHSQFRRGTSHFSGQFGGANKIT